MSKCFVIQPFDGRMFDKRYEDIFDPAIRDAGVEPYRVDHDPKVNIPIEDIEAGIRSADLCLAEISTDNPNVWYELGFAIASRKEMVLVCAVDRRTSFPFDVRHRTIINYSTDSTQDFEKLKNKITTRIKAILEKDAIIGETTELSPIVPVQGLEPHEITCLVAVANNLEDPKDIAPAYTIIEDMQRFGYTRIAVTLALATLLKKNMLSVTKNEQYKLKLLADK